MSWVRKSLSLSMSLRQSTIPYYRRSVIAESIDCTAPGSFFTGDTTVRATARGAGRPAVQDGFVFTALVYSTV